MIHTCVQQRQTFPPVAPDLVLELLLPTDRLSVVEAKMQEYTASGVRLGWLIDPASKPVEIYRQGQAPELLNAPAQLDGENVLPGFSLNLSLV